MAFGPTSTGYVLKTLNDIISEVKTKLETIQDPISGEFLQPDFTGNDPTMQIILLALIEISKVWEANQITYNQFDPSKAAGAALSSLVQLNGIERLIATSSTVNLELTGTPLLLISAGQIISDVARSQDWIINDPFTFDVAGEATALATSINTGPITAGAGTLTNIITPQTGWDTVTNPSDAIPGRDEETDAQLRQRRKGSTSAPSAGPAEAVFQNLRNVEGVTSASVIINNTLLSDSNGIPPKSIAAIVEGGEDEDVAKVLLARSGGGIDYHGTTTFPLIDLQGFTYNVKFTRPDPILIFVEVDITITDASDFPPDGEDQIKEDIVSYSLSGAAAFDITEGFDETGYLPGEDVIRTRLFTPINSVPGHEINSLKIGNPTLGTSNITIAYNELAVFDVSRITVIIT